MTETNTPSKNSLLPWFMWLLGALFYCYEFLLQVSPNVMTDDLMREFSVNAAQLGNLSAFFYYAYAFMQIPIGTLLDRFGSRRLLTIASLLCAVGAFTFGTAHIFIVAAIGRALIGVGAAFAAISCMHIAATWLPIRHFALMTGLLLTIGMLGAVFGQAPLSIVINHLGWRPTMITFGFIGITLSALIWFIVRDNPHFQHEHQSLRLAIKSLLSSAWLVMHNKQLWIISIYAGLMFLSILTFGGLWGTNFLVHSYQLPEATAAFIVSFIFIGFALGSPIFGLISDRIRRRKPPMIIGSIGSLLTLTCVLYIPNLPLPVIGGLLFALGFFCSGFLTLFSMAREITMSANTGAALGFANTLNSFGGAIGQPIVGVLLGIYWSGQMINGAPFYSVSNFHFALAALPICIIISMLFLPFIKETYCKQIIKS